MSETPEDGSVPGYGATDRRLHRTVAWVGIVAGVVFTVAVIFLSGLALGRVAGGTWGWHRDYPAAQMAPGRCPMMDRVDGPDDRKPGMMAPTSAPVPARPAPAPAGR